ncbi:MAG TPA: hypothetical protein VI423_08075 [Paenisporosarcina sp.]|nr:hypothetical protein [Paenisporosarcina sp.]
MKYSIGDIVVCNTETRPNGSKRILICEPDESWILGSGAFQIAAKHDSGAYSLIVDEGMIGWFVGEFHVRHQNFSAGFLNKKFYDVTEEHIVKKAK